MASTTKDVNYLTNRLESEAIEALVPITGLNALLTEDTTNLLGVRTTGNTLVYLVGKATATSSIPLATALFTLPVGFRPSTTQCIVGSVTTASGAALLVMEIASTGIVTNADIIANNGVLAFAGIPFFRGL